MKTKKLTLLAMLSAIALTIFMVEAQIPALVPIPGVKMGLANIVTVFAVFALGPKEGAAVLFVRIFLGAVAHSIGQMAMAILLTSTPGLIAYLPVMIAISIVTGCFTGLCAQFLVNRGNLWKTISK